MTVEEAVAHMGGKINNPSKYVRERVRDELPHYLWVVGDLDSRRRRIVICEWCDMARDEKKTGGRWEYAYKQGKKMVCPYCGGDVIVKHYGRGWGKLYDRLQVVWYQKSAVDPDAVVAVGAHCSRNFSYSEGKPWLLEPEIDVRSFSVIVPGEGGHRFKQEIARWELVGGLHQMWKPARFRFVPVKRHGKLTFGCAGGYSFARLNPLSTVLLEDTLRDALKGTTLERGWSDEYMEDGDGTRALNMIAKYPCVEYLTKLGMTDFVKDYVSGLLPTHLINWRGKTKEAVLKTDRGRLGELKHAGFPMTPALLALYQWTDANGIKLPAATAFYVAKLCERWGSLDGIPGAIESILSYHERSRWKKVLKYMGRQAERYASERLHLGDFRDYWRLCIRFDESLEDDATAFPSSIREAEGRMNARERRERNKLTEEQKAIQDKLIERQYKRLLRQYGFSFGGLTLRPAMTGDEVRNEGEELHHCVASYVNNYAEGRTVICVLRRDVEPERPWRTVEISASTGKLVQDRGYRNDTSMGTPLTANYRAALDLFWEAWRERNGGKTA
ncbi:MAG: PcfJ domain-containing protein [Oscillospiraceae bacterium]|nr:PcfJ domain-containing protein [Oscillospiraceae bacterium]